MQLYPEQAIPQFPMSEQHPSFGLSILSRFSVSLEALIKYILTQASSESDTIEKYNQRATHTSLQMTTFSGLMETLYSVGVTILP